VPSKNGSTFAARLHQMMLLVMIDVNNRLIDSLANFLTLEITLHHRGCC
jgi:hypothetical protein